MEKGGAAEALSLQIEGGTVRKVYTYTGAQALLTDSSNAFVPTNTAITNAMLNVADDTARQSLFTRYATGYSATSSIPSRPWWSTKRKTVIYVGANDGLLHAIDDDTGQELWSFIPPDHLGRL